MPHKADVYFWEVLKNSKITLILTNLLGPNTLLQTSKLNTKAPSGGAAVEWHQDWAFYPHSNDDVLAFAVFLEDVTEENGPLMVIPKSHKGPILSHFSNGLFCGAVDPEDPNFKIEKAVKLVGKAGDMTVHHAHTLHGSAPNISTRSRMILFYECNAVDAWPLLGASSYIHSLGKKILERPERAINNGRIFHFTSNGKCTCFNTSSNGRKSGVNIRITKGWRSKKRF